MQRRDAPIEAAAVVLVGPTLASAYDAAKLAGSFELEADEALAHAIGILRRRAEKHRLDGFATLVLLDEIELPERRCSPSARTGATEQLRSCWTAPPESSFTERPVRCSSHERPMPKTLRHSIVVGHDGSRHAANVLEVAQRLGARYGRSLSVMVALAGNVSASVRMLADYEDR